MPKFTVFKLKYETLSNGPVFSVPSRYLGAHYIIALVICDTINHHNTEIGPNRIIFRYRNSVWYAFTLTLFITFTKLFTRTH